MARFDWDLSPKELVKRMSKWTDRTLINRLEKLTGREVYKPTTKRKLKGGRFRIAPTVRVQLENRYGKAIKQATEEQRERMLPRASWTRIEKWLQQMAKKFKSEDDEDEGESYLNVEFSYSRLLARGLFWVYRRGQQMVFTNKKPLGTLSFPKNVPQYVVYTITVDDEEGVETWVQVSAPNFYYGEPLGKEAIEQGQDVVNTFQEENERAGASRPNAFRYSWWAHNANESVYTFLGLGVAFA